MLKSIENMLLTFDKEGIKYCHFKSNSNLIISVNGDEDLDMLFDPNQKKEIEVILNQCGLKRFRSTSHMQYNAIEDFIGFDKETSKIWHLHLHYRLSLGEKHLKGYTVPWTKRILENRVYDKEFNIYRSKPEDEYFLLLLRIALKLRWRDIISNIDENDLAEITWLKKRSSNQEIVETALNLTGEKVSEEYAKILNKKLVKQRDLFKLQKLLRQAMKQFTSFNIVSSYSTRSIRELSWFITGVFRRLNISSSKPKRRVSPSGGAVVAIIGSDGAGKSTTLKHLKKEYGKKIDVKSVYMGSGDGSSSIIRYPMKLIAGKVGGKGLGTSINKEAKISNKPKQSLKAKLYSTAKFIWAITLAMEKRKKLKAITKARNNGILVLTDRYPQIEVVGYNDGPLLYKYIDKRSRLLKKMAKWEYSIYKSAYINPPDLVIKLMVPPELAMERKPEMTKSEIEAKINAVRKIDLTKNSVEIDTSKNKEITFGEVMEEIWKEI